MPWKRQHVVYFIENQVLVAHGVLPIEAEAKPCADVSFYELLFLKCRNATMHCSEYQESGTLSILDASKDPSRFHPVNLMGGCVCTFDVLLLPRQEICEDEVLHGNPLQTCT